nr:hypothetical protein [Tanacetum cinerariifolium]
QQVALDESLVPSTQRLRIGKSNFRLPSDIQSKESTLQVVYDVLWNSPLFRAFQVTEDVLEIYMQEFWVTAKLHHNSIHFKIDTKKSVLDLEAFREMLHISPRIPNQSFADLPSEEEILDFLRFLGHSHEIRYLTDGNFKLSQAQMLWGFYHRINIDFAYLIWEDFVYQVEQKNQKRSNEMNYPRLMKVIIDYFMTRKPSISRRNRINWHYARDDALFSTIKVAAPKLKASARKKKGDSASSTTPPTPTPTTIVESAPRLSGTTKGKQPARAITPTEQTDVQRTEAKQLKIALKRSRQETYISQQRGSGTDEGTAFREMLHISPRIPSQSFVELPSEEQILEFLRINVDFAYLIWEDFVYQVEHKNQKRSNEMYYPIFTKVIIDYFMSRKPSISRRNRINWHYVRDDVLFSTIKVVSRHQATQQYGAILTIELTTDEIKNSKAYKEYYACATGEAAPKPKASERKKKGDSASSTTPPTPTPTTTVVSALRLSAIAKGKQPARATTPTEPTDVERTEAKQLKIVLKRSRQETHISQQCGSGTDEGTGSRQGVSDVPSDDSEEELSWNSFDDEEGDEQTKGREESEGDKTEKSDDGSNDGNNNDDDKTVKAGSESDKDDDENDDEEEPAKNDDEDTEFGKGGDEELRLSKEARIQEEEEADELYRDVNINQGRGLQVTQIIEDSHVTLTPIHPDGPQESSSVSLFVTSMLNPISDAGVESIFTTASSSIVSLQTPTPIMTPSTIATITTFSDAPIPPTTIPIIILENLPTFNSVFRFDERLRSLETTFFEYRQTNPFVDDVSTIPADLSEMELKKILIEKMKGDKYGVVFETTSQMDVQTPTSMATLLMSTPTMTPSTISNITTTSQAPILPTTASSTIIQDLPNFGS